MAIRAPDGANNSNDNNDNNGNVGGRSKKNFHLIEGICTILLLAARSCFEIGSASPVHLLSPYPPPKIRKTLLSNNKSQHSLIFEQIPLKIRPKCINKIIADNSISHIYQRSEHQRYIDFRFDNHYEGLLPPWIFSLSDVIKFGKIAN